VEGAWNSPLQAVGVLGRARAADEDAGGRPAHGNPADSGQPRPEEVVPVTCTLFLSTYSRVRWNVKSRLSELKGTG
jgi:hypothetical protein